MALQAYIAGIGIRRPRNKYRNVAESYLSYCKKRKRRGIVNINRHYVRPIIRGKGIKSVEFGAKVNNIQIDDISFIEHLSFKAFNEGIRLKVRCLAADSIYANNANRKFCTRYGISTSFVRKGRAAKDEPGA